VEKLLPELTNFKWTDFKLTNFKWTDFKWANFKWTNFKFANFKFANFKYVLAQMLLVMFNDCYNLSTPFEVRNTLMQNFEVKYDGKFSYIEVVLNVPVRSKVKILFLFATEKLCYLY